MITQDLLENFLNEILEALINIDFILTNWENDLRNPKHIKQIYEVFHKVKYDCNIIGAETLQQISEASEEMIEQIHFHLHTIDDIPIDLLRQSADAFTAIVKSLLRDRNEGDLKYLRLIEHIQQKIEEIKQLD